MRNVFFILISCLVLVAQVSYAQDQNQSQEFIKKIIADSGAAMDYSISFTLKSPPPPLPKTKEENELSFYEEGLSKEDIKLGNAIYKAMLLCETFKEHAIIDQGRIFLLIQYAREQYNQSDKKIDFMHYLANLISEHFSCMKSWLKYYKAFLKEDKE